MPHHSYAKRLLSLALVISAAGFFLKKLCASFAISFLSELLREVIIPILNYIFINQSDSAGEDANRNKRDDNEDAARRNKARENETQINARNESDIGKESDDVEEKIPIKQNDGKGNDKQISGKIKQIYGKK